MASSSRRRRSASPDSRWAATRRSTVPTTRCSRSRPPAGSSRPASAKSQGEDAWASASLQPDQSKQFLTLYQALQGFDDRAAEATIPNAVEKLAIVGEKDEIQYGPTWGDVFVSLAAPTIQAREELEQRGWEVRILEGLDHTTAMQTQAVLPILRPWLERIAAKVAAQAAGV